MKNIFIILGLLSPLFCFPQWTPGILRAVVQGDTVILKDDTTTRNCASLYHMKISKFNSNTIIWTQEEYGGGAGCECLFNLSVSIDSLNAGHYIAKVYDAWWPGHDSLYVGSISFDISKQNPIMNPVMISEEQSNCFDVGIPIINNSSNDFLTVFPNPTNGKLTLSTKLTGEKSIFIYDFNNKCVFQDVMKDDMRIIDVNKLPSSIYVLTVSNNEKIFHTKFFKK